MHFYVGLVLLYDRTIQSQVSSGLNTTTKCFELVRLKSLKPFWSQYYSYTKFLLILSTLKFTDLNRAKANKNQLNIMSQRACSFKQGNKGRLMILLLTVSKYRQHLQRSALANYCIVLLADKVHSKRFQSLHCYIFHIQIRKQAMCPVRLLWTASKHSSQLVWKMWCGSLLFYSLALDLWKN